MKKPYVVALLLLAGCFPEGTKVDYTPGSANRTFTSREEALSIVRAGWEYRSSDGFKVRSATNDGLVVTLDYKTSDNVLDKLLRGKQVYTCPHHAVKECEIRQGFGPGRKCVVFVHASVPSPWGGDDIFDRADFANEEDAKVFADALMYLARPASFPRHAPPESTTTPKEEGAAHPKEPTQPISKPDHVGVIESVNKRWEFILITPSSAQHAVRPGARLHIKRGSRVVVALIVTKVTPSSITTKASPAEAMELVQVGDKAYEE